MAKLATGSIDLTLTGLSTVLPGLRGVNSSLARMAVVGGVAGAAVAGIAAALATTVREASTAREAIARFGQVFKGETGEARQFIESLSESLKRSKFAVLDSFTAFQSFFVGMDFSAKSARILSQRMQRLNLDFAAFQNISDDEAFTRFVSALAGSVQVLDRFGVNLKSGALDQELLRRGFKKISEGATEAEKTIGRISLLMRAMAQQGAIGAAARESDEFAQASQGLGQAIKESAIAIGQIFLPAASTMVVHAREGARAFSQWAQTLSGEFDPAVGKTQSKLQKLINELAIFSTIVGPLELVLSSLTPVGIGNLAAQARTSTNLEPLPRSTIEAYKKSLDESGIGDVTLPEGIGKKKGGKGRQGRIETGDAMFRRIQEAALGRNEDRQLKALEIQVNEQKLTREAVEKLVDRSGTGMTATVGR